MVMATPSPQQVGREFVRQYYTVLHEAPEVLHRFYSSGSTFVHGGVDRPGLTEEPVTGQLEIDAKIKLLNFKDCHTKIRQVDSQATIGSGVVVQVTGELSNNGEPMRRFMQTFVLAPQTPKKFYVHNDIFRYQDEVYQDQSDTESEDHQSSSIETAVSATAVTNNTPTTISSTNNGSSSGQSSKVNMPYYQAESNNNNSVSVTVQQQQQQQPSLSSSSSSSSTDLDNKLQDLHVNEPLHNGHHHHNQSVDGLHHQHNNHHHGNEAEVGVTEEKIVTRAQLKTPTPSPSDIDVVKSTTVTSTTSKVDVVAAEYESGSSKKDEALSSATRSQESTQGGSSGSGKILKIEFRRLGLTTEYLRIDTLKIF
jgi:hypothetical protein